MSGKSLLVVFDVDDTLYPEIQFVRSGFRAVAQMLDPDARQHRPLADKMWQLFKEHGSGKVFDLLLHSLNKQNPDMILKCVDTYREHDPEIQPFDRVSTALTSLQDRGMVLALLSDGFSHIQYRKLKKMNLDHHFKHACFTPDLKTGQMKPHPAGFLQLQQKLKFESQRCVYIADNPEKDFVAPNQLGWRSIQMIQPEQIHSTRQAPSVDHRPRHVVESYAELTEYLLRKT